MSRFDTHSDKWLIECGDLVLWQDDEGHPVACRVALVTDDRVYLRAGREQTWFASRLTRRLVPRHTAIKINGVVHVPWGSALVMAPVTSEATSR